MQATTKANVPLGAPMSATSAPYRPAGSDSQKRGLFSRGPVGIIVVAVHVVLIYALAASMGIVQTPTLSKPMEATIIDQPQDKQEPVQVVKPELETPPVETPPIEDTIPEPEIVVDEPAPAAITAEASPAPPVQETANMTVSRRVDPVYPAGSRRDGEQGSGMFRVLVDEKGRPVDVQIAKSSGFPRLDEAAVAAIRKWAFKPAVQNGQPVQSWTRVAVSFKLENA
jgi:periplasmic protein TonB